MNPETEPAAAPRRSAWPLRAGLTAALLAAFVLGLVFPRDEPAVDPASRGAARKRVPVEAMVDAAGASIRLVDVTQSGDRIAASFQAGSGFSDPRLIDGAAVEVSVFESAGSGSTFGLAEANLVAGHDGFTITGRLAVPGDLTMLRISSIQVRDQLIPEWRADLSSIWPVTGSEPSLLRISRQVRAVPGGSVALVAILGWQDRLEAVFELRNAADAVGTASRIVAFDMLVTTRGAPSLLRSGRAIAAIDTEQVSTGQVMARFESVPPDAGEVTIRATRLMSFVQGPWTWRLTSGPDA